MIQELSESFKLLESFISSRFDLTSQNGEVVGKRLMLSKLINKAEKRLIKFIRRKVEMFPRKTK